ncbi:MAG: glycosyl hydrolase [Cyclobacteriaceae bacterium]|nr:glycosyl hydrolase [Cyclobacteriaceae bacterium]
MKKYFLLFALSAFILQPAIAQKKKSKKGSATTVNVDTALYNGLKWRNIGPFRGGRSAAVTGVAGKPNLFYMGTTGGGVWKTEDGGSTWKNISDGYFGGSIGAVAVSEYDNNVIYVGGGEVTVRGNVSDGYGMFKSVDAGETWEFIGLKDSKHIPRIRIHPKNPDIVYAAVLGDLYKSTQERGVYKSTDGGKTWRKVLYANSDAGAVDLIIDPNNPRILYASTWNVRRTPYSLSSGGEGSALWKSTDEGEHWENISENKGLPEGVLGIIGVTVSPVNSNRVWAIMEAKEGGVFRSDDAGKTWRKVNDERKLRQRAWYYSRIYADTQDENKVYVVNVQFHVSSDGGKSFESPFRTPHGDHHDLWIAPEDPNRMIVADDGGAQVSYDAGTNWSTYMNQPTAQFYRVVTDNHFPYRIYGAQQDNSTIRISHRSSGGSITEDDWEPSAGGESAHIAPDPKDDDIVYGGSYDGFLTRYDYKREMQRAINVWPDNPMGHGAEDFKYRFQWNFPIMFSPMDKNKLYAFSNHVHVTTNEGQSWEVISPDLTRNDPSTLKSSGGPITQDNTSVEYYGTIFAAAISYHEPDVLWTGSDDGLIYITKDGGANWQNVTPAGMPEWMMINSIDIDPFNKGGVYVAGTKYKSGDYKPYLYHTTDYGANWTKITNGIPPDQFTRVVRADPNQKGLLYAGTESGMFVSFDDGASWQTFQQNLPIVPITDLAIKNDNLIAATQGRSFWMIDDLTALHQVTKANAGVTMLLKPMPTYRMGGGSRGTSLKAGENHPGGVMTYFYLPNEPDSTTNITLTYLEMDGDTIQHYSSTAKKKKEKLEVKKGLNRFVWNTRYPEAKDFEGMILWWASTAGPKAVPGTYKVVLSYGDNTQTQEFEILKDPRQEATQEDLQAQFDFLIKVRDKLSETSEAIINIRKARKQINFVKEKLGEDNKAIADSAKAVLKKMKAVEEALYQTKNRSGQDPLNFPIRLNNKLGHLASLASMGDYKPTDQDIAFEKEVSQQIDVELEKLKLVFSKDIPHFNQMVGEANIPAVKLE